MSHTIWNAWQPSGQRWSDGPMGGGLLEVVGTVVTASITENSNATIAAAATATFTEFTAAA